MLTHGSVGASMMVVDSNITKVKCEDSKKRATQTQIDVRVRVRVRVRVGVGVRVSVSVIKSQFGLKIKLYSYLGTLLD